MISIRMKYVNILIFMECCFSFIGMQLYAQVAYKHAPAKYNGQDVIHAVMVKPKYRNAIYASMEDPDTIKIKTLIKDITLQDIHLDISLDRNDVTLKSWSIRNLNREMILNLPVSDITFGYTRSEPFIKDDNPYKFTLVLKQDTAIVDTDILLLNKYPAPPLGVDEVRLDDKDNLIINGEKELVFGAYLLQYNTGWYSYLESLGFNFFVEWGSQLTGGYHSANTWGLIRTNSGSYDNIDGARNNIVTYRNSKKLLAYRTVDEPNSHGITPETCRLHYKAAREEDPYHPVLITIKYNDHPAQHNPYTGYTECADIFGLDLYPIYNDGVVTDMDIGVAHNNYKYLHNSELGKSDWELEEMPTAAIPQMFNQSHWRLPQNTELKNLLFQHVAGGAKFFFPYSYENKTGYNDTWEYFAHTLIPELVEMKDAIFAKEEVSGLKISSTNDDRLVWSHRITEDKEYVILVNTTSKWNNSPGSQEQRITATLTFGNVGENNFYSLVKDSEMPNEFVMVNNEITVELNGINETSSGVLVLVRNINPTSSTLKVNITDDFMFKNSPNPFYSNTDFMFTLQEDGEVKLKVFDISGREVASVVNDYLFAGSYKYDFNGGGLQSGVYVCRLRFNSRSTLIKAIKIK